jgi:RimJ/RimL family protein N-acetyltransferase
LDQFIGEADYIDKGYGTAMLIEFKKLLMKTHPQIKKIITEADPQNFRAQKCYD